MSSDSFVPTRNRLVVEGEQLVLLNVSPSSLGLTSVNDVRQSELAVRPSWKCTFWQRIARCFEWEGAPDGSHPIPTVWVPSGTHLILKDIPDALQQRYGLEEQEGAIVLRSDPDASKVELRFNNGALIRLHDLRVGQLIEVLSLAGTQSTLFEPELQTNRT